MMWTRHRPAIDRGATKLPWLDSRHAFSFGRYYDPAWMGFEGLRVLNEDVVEPSRGFGPHPHRDAEILSFVLSGALLHEDSTGAHTPIRAGEVQRMTAGRGVVHAEWNASDDEPVHFIQVWLEPRTPGLPATFEHAAPRWREADGLSLVASGDGRDGSLRIEAEASIWAGRLAAGDTATHALGAGRSAWLQILDGELEAGGLPLVRGDGLAIRETDAIDLHTTREAELLLFDLASGDDGWDD